MGCQGNIALGSCAALCRIALLCGMTPVARRGNLQDFADRLDPVGIAVLIDKVLQDLSRRLDAEAWAKKALAVLRMLLARRSSLTSRSRALIRSRSLELRPSRWPLSTS